MKAVKGKHMYKEKTFENILADILKMAPQGIDTSCGSLFYDAVAPFAMELSKLYTAYGKIMDEAFPDTASLPYLIRHGEKLGIVRKEATNAVFSGKFDKPIGEGTRFLLGGFGFYSGELLRYQNGYYYYKMYAEEAGTDVNGCTGDFVPLSYVSGLTVSSFDSVILAGCDEEDIEDFRRRVCSASVSAAYGGNAADYKSYILGLEGVGGVKIFPAWAGGGTVRALVQGDDGGTPTSELIDRIKSLLDPDAYSGLGAGVAPIGHRVTVDGVNGCDILIKTSLSYADGWNSTSALTHITKAVKDYISELRSMWQDSDETAVRISQIDSAIIKTGCVVDVSGTMIYSADEGEYLAKNLLLSEEFVPIFKEITAV